MDRYDHHGMVGSMSGAAMCGETEEPMLGDIYVVIGSGPDTLILNDSTDLVPGSEIECWSPKRFNFQSFKIIGVVNKCIECKMTSKQDTDIPAGSLVLSPANPFASIYLSKYYKKMYNEAIAKIMDIMHVNDYQLP